MAIWWQWTICVFTFEQENSISYTFHKCFSSRFSAYKTVLIMHSAPVKHSYKGMTIPQWLREPPFEKNWFMTVTDNQLALFSGGHTFTARWPSSVDTSGIISAFRTRSVCFQSPPGHHRKINYLLFSSVALGKSRPWPVLPKPTQFAQLFTAI